jgi:hypothetical protein
MINLQTEADAVDTQAALVHGLLKRAKSKIP